MTDGAGEHRQDPTQTIIIDPGVRIDELRKIAAELTRKQAEIRDRLTDTRVRIERSRAEQVSSCDADSQREQQVLSTRIALGREQLSKERETALSAVISARDSAIADHERETRILTERAREVVDEGRWIAETLVESIQRKAAQDLASHLKSATDALEALTPLRKLYGSTGLDAASVGELPDLNDDPDRIAQSLEQESSQASLHAKALEMALNSAWMSWVPAICAVIVVVLITVAASAFVGADTRMTLAVYGLVVAAVLFIGLSLLRFGMRAKCRPMMTACECSVIRVERVAEVLKASAKRIHDAKVDGAQARRDSELARARARAATDSKLLESRKKELVELKTQHERTVEEETKRWDNRQRRLDEESARLMKELVDQRAGRLRDIESKSAESVASAEREAAAAGEDVRVRWKQVGDSFERECSLVREHAQRVNPHWANGKSVPPVCEQGLPEMIPLGEIEIACGFATVGTDISDANRSVVGNDRWSVPTGLDLRGRGSLLVYHDADGRKEAVSLLHNAMLRLLALCPAGKARFTILDPVALGESFASLMHLADVEPLIVGDRIWTESRHIEQRLADITEHMEQVIQKYLRNQFATIHEYNMQAGEVAEPLRFLVIADFPANLTDAALARLKGIIMSGQRCGVYVLMMTDAKPHASVKPMLSDLEGLAMTVSVRSGVMRPFDSRVQDGVLHFERPPEGAQLVEVMAALGDKIRNSSRVRVPFGAVAPDDGSMWTLSAAQELTVALGRAGARRMQHLSLGRGTAQHALVAGRTGSGKSTLFHVMITNLALWYSPDEIEFYLIDFKKGVEFKAYATHGLPHARVIAVESEREFGLSVLRRLDAELSQRGQLFREAGAQDISGYRRIRPNERMPRILLAVDEFQEFFIEDDRLSQDAALLLDRLVRQGRAFGMHLVMGSQTLGGAFSIARSTIGQMAVRIALQSSEQDSYLIMSEENTAPRLLTRPGEAIYNDQSGAVEGNSPFQIVWLGEEERDRELQRIKSLAASRQGSYSPAIVFEGNLPAHVESESRRWFTMSGDRKELEPQMWLGDAVSIKDPTSARMRRRSGGNLLIVGNDQEASEVIQLVGMLSLMKQHVAAKFRVLDVSHFSSDRGDVWEAVRHAGISPDTLRIDDAPQRTLAEVSAELAAREADPGWDRPPMFLFVNGIHRFRDLRKSDDFDFSSDPDKPEKPSETLTRILKEGSAFGIHVVAWCDGVNNLERFLNRQTMREFALRIVFQMSATDSTHVIDSPVAQSLGRGRALLYDDETSNVEKFRPYARPSREWIASMIRALMPRD